MLFALITACGSVSGGVWECEECGSVRSVGVREECGSVRSVMDVGV